VKLSLEAIGVLGILYCLFMYGTFKALRAKRKVRREAETKAELKPAGTVLDARKDVATWSHCRAGVPVSFLHVRYSEGATGDEEKISEDPRAAFGRK